MFSHAVRTKTFATPTAHEALARTFSSASAICMYDVIFADISPPREIENLGTPRKIAPNDGF
jgi:hypothetical protein